MGVLKIAGETDTIGTINDAATAIVAFGEPAEEE